jgi:hypothetical protein
MQCRTGERRAEIQWAEVAVLRDAKAGRCTDGYRMHSSRRAWWVCYHDRQCHGRPGGEGAALYQKQAA